MFTKNLNKSIALPLSTLLVGSLLISACSPTIPESKLPDPIATSAPIATPELTLVPTADGMLQISLETGNLALGFNTETIKAKSTSENTPYWEVLPEYTLVTLEGYPISEHLMQPQIFIYPVEDLVKVNEGAGDIVTSLQTLLKSPQEIDHMPFLPLVNASQVIHVHLQYLDFKNGQGLRYLTEFDQGLIPINNSELIYTYQGLTSDGKYYVAAVLPVNHPSLPADGKITGNEALEFTSDFSMYLVEVVKNLNSLADNSFSLDLARLDAMMSSLEIK